MPFVLAVGLCLVSFAFYFVCACVCVPFYVWSVNILGSLQAASAAWRASSAQQTAAPCCPHLLRFRPRLCSAGSQRHGALHVAAESVLWQRESGRAWERAEQALPEEAVGWTRADAVRCSAAVQAPLPRKKDKHTEGKRRVRQSQRGLKIIKESRERVI